MNIFFKAARQYLSTSEVRGLVCFLTFFLPIFLRFFSNFLFAYILANLAIS
jgi:hypothetical protein